MTADRFSKGMFHTGTSFIEGAVRCLHMVPVPGEPDRYSSPIEPGIVSLAFACELLLKCLIARERVKVPQIHRLDRLFNDLTKEEQKAVRKRYAELARVPRLSLRDHLNELSNCFEEWRYLYEGTQQLRVDRLFYLAQALFDIITDAEPEWEDNSITRGMLEEGPPNGIVWLRVKAGGVIQRLQL